MSYTYAYPRPAVTVDAAVFRMTGKGTEILLIQRKNEPFKGGWALPGGFVDMDETLEEAIQRELAEETGLTNLELNQLHAFSSLERDPRGRTISVVFIGVCEEDAHPKAGDDARKLAWFHIGELPNLAFDHQDVMDMAIKRMATVEKGQP